jgi:hypothetical protein
MKNPVVISHKYFSTFDEAFLELKPRAEICPEQQRNLAALSEFPFGRYLIQNRGLNGYWTHYVCTYPQWKHKESIHPLEKEILETFPVFIATQERFKIFQKLISQRIQSRRNFASIPCGLMGDLLLLDYGNQEVTLHGIDLDEESLIKARNLASEKQLFLKTKFECKDAWHLQALNLFDLIVSNGLNIYECYGARPFSAKSGRTRQNLTRPFLA